MIHISDVIPALPEILIFCGILCMILMGVFVKKSTHLLLSCAALLLIGVIGLCFYLPNLKDLAFNGQFISDSFTVFIKVIISVVGVAVLLLLRHSHDFLKVRSFEFSILFLTSILGMFVMISSQNFITLFVGLELQSLSLYVLLGLHHEERYVTEALIKYFVLGAVASALLLFGISLVYGSMGSLNFAALEKIISTINAKNISSFYPLFAGMVFIIAGLAFKISAVPFHMWAPDVYQGTPYSIFLFFATAPKIAGLGLLMRLVSGPFYLLQDQWQPILLGLSILSMVVGAVAAILQTNMKRFLAYASISSIGFSLLGVGLASEEGLRASLFYTTLYIVALMGLLFCFKFLLKRGLALEDLADLKGIAKEKPFLAGVMAIFIFSLAGLPPFPGFLGKLFLLQAAISGEYYILSFIMVMTTVVSVYYYLNILKILFFETSPAHQLSLISRHFGAGYGVIGFSLALLVFIIFAPTYLLNWCGLAASTLFYA